MASWPALPPPLRLRGPAVLLAVLRRLRLTRSVPLPSLVPQCPPLPAGLSEPGAPLSFSPPCELSSHFFDTFLLLHHHSRHSAPHPATARRYPKNRRRITASTPQIKPFFFCDFSPSNPQTREHYENESTHFFVIARVAELIVNSLGKIQTKHSQFPFSSPTHHSISHFQPTIPRGSFLSLRKGD